jgi:predicted nucleic acid-binding protein
VNVVVDASILVELIVASEDRPSRWLRDLLAGDDLYWVPGLTPLEVASALARSSHATKWMPSWQAKDCAGSLRSS